MKYFLRKTGRMPFLRARRSMTVFSVLVWAVCGLGMAQGAAANECEELAKKLAAKRAEYRALVEENGYWEATQKTSGRSKPGYEVNAEHLPPVKRGKTPLPDSAEDLFKKAIPDPARDGQAWWARDAEGNYHRYMGAPRGPDSQVIVHWNGSTAPTTVGTPLRLNDVPSYIKKRFDLRDEIIKLVKRAQEAGGPAGPRAP